MPDAVELDIFKRAVESDANAQYETIMAQINKMSAQEKTVTEDSVLDTAYRLIHEEIGRLETANGREIARLRQAARARLAEQRAEIERQVFEMVRERFKNFIGGPEYPEYLRSLVKTAVKQRPDGSGVIYISPDDEMHLPLLLEAAEGCDVKTSPGVGRGGILLENKREGYLVDLRLQTRIEEQRARFRAACGLKIC